MFQKVPLELVYAFYTFCIVGFGVLTELGRRLIKRLSVHETKLETIDRAVNQVTPGTAPLTKRFDKLADSSLATLVTASLTAALVFFIPNTDNV